VQGIRDAERLANGGEPWPSSFTRAQIGQGLYAWDNIEIALAYLKKQRERVHARGEDPDDISIYILKINQADLDNFSIHDMTQLSDEEVNIWMETHSMSPRKEARPHEFP
jgi:hypothetical protein